MLGGLLLPFLADVGDVVPVCRIGSFWERECATTSATIRQISGLVRHETRWRKLPQASRLVPRVPGIRQTFDVKGIAIGRPALAFNVFDELFAAASDTFRKGQYERRRSGPDSFIKRFKRGHLVRFRRQDRVGAGIATFCMVRRQPRRRNCWSCGSITSARSREAAVGQRKSRILSRSRALTDDPCSAPGISATAAVIVAMSFHDMTASGTGSLGDRRSASAQNRRSANRLQRDNRKRFPRFPIDQ